MGLTLEAGVELTVEASSPKTNVASRGFPNEVRVNPEVSESDEETVFGSRSKSDMKFGTK